MDAVTRSQGELLDERVGDRTIHGRGTPERSWRSWGGLASLSPMSIHQLVPAGRRVVVVAPHPDDEVLGCGGTLSLLARAGRTIEVIGVTDGEGSHPDSLVWTPSMLARRRREERAAGLVRLGVASHPHELGLPDGAITNNEHQLAGRLAALIRPGDVVLATWRLDGHPDHEATGRAAASAAARHGCDLWELPVWMWHWAEPGDVRVPWQRMSRVAMDTQARERKSHAIAAHGSQLVDAPSERRPPVLPDWALTRLLRPFEIFIAPESM